MVIKRYGFDPETAWSWTLREFVLAWAVEERGYQMSDKYHADREWGRGLEAHLREKGII